MWRHIGTGLRHHLLVSFRKRDEVKIGFPGSRQGIKQAERDSSLVNLLLDSNIVKNSNQLLSATLADMAFHQLFLTYWLTFFAVLVYLSEDNM